MKLSEIKIGETYHPSAEVISKCRTYQTWIEHYQVPLMIKVTDKVKSFGNVYLEYDIVYPNTGEKVSQCCSCIEAEDLSIIHKKKTIMSTMKSIIKNLTRSEPEKTFVDVGFLDENEDITEEGRTALEHILWEQNKDALKELADNVNKETKE